MLTLAPRTLGNIITGNDAQTDAVLASGAVPVFVKLLQHPKMNIVKEAAWTVSNFTVGSNTKIQTVIDYCTTICSCSILSCLAVTLPANVMCSVLSIVSYVRFDCWVHWIV